MRISARTTTAMAWLATLVALGTPAPAAGQDPLPLRRVMLSTGGVAYLEHEATVDGDATLPLTVRLGQVDDVLKSLVVHDERGSAGTVSLPGREPLRDTFRDLPFPREALESPVALLRALAGTEVRVTGARALQGRLLAVTPEEVVLPGGLGRTTRHRVSLVVPDQGVRQFLLEEADQVELVDPALRTQVAEALAAVARHRVQDRRTLTLTLRGAGQRTVRVGYVVEAPLWKASYRLTVPQAGAGGAAAAGSRGLLQGWAVVENLSGLDWNAVELTLLSGNPVTLRQALYTAYYVPRPEVPVEVMGRVLPRVDAGALAESRRDAARAAVPAAPTPLQTPPVAGARRAPEAPAPAPPAAAAATEEATTQVLFRVATPVVLPSGSSLVIPIASREVPVERVALYDGALGPAHPLAAVRLRNDGGASLPPGVLTLYERPAGGDSAYVGDARLGPLPAGESRLLSFAVDQKTQVAADVERRERSATGRFGRGVFQLTVVEQHTTRYRVKAPAEEPRTLLIEHPRRADWRLVTPPEHDVELTRDRIRVRAALAAGESRVVEVTVERPQESRVEIREMTTETMLRHARTGALDDKVKQAFETLVRLRQDLEREEQGVREAEAARARIGKEQERLRANLASVPATSDLHRRYLDLLRQQEDQLAALAQQGAAAEARARAARERLADAIGRLQT